MKLIGHYKNGNYQTSIYSDGTRIRETEGKEFIPEFAENIDIKLCNRCDRNCCFCHEGSTVDGRLGNIMEESFVNTLHPYQEVALGGGNILEHPDLIPFLKKLKSKKVIANVTLNQVHFEQQKALVEQLVREQLVFGIGISLVKPSAEFIREVKRFPNAVIHAINGVLGEAELEALADQNLKLLILGFKRLRRGEDWYQKNQEDITAKQRWLKEHLPAYLQRFQVVSFDNLAIEQLEVKKLLTEMEWEEFYAGDDGTHTFYIDMVERKFAESSTAEPEKRYELLESVDEMFQRIVTERNMRDRKE